MISPIKNKFNYKVAFIFALLLHVILGGFFFGKFATPLYGQQAVQRKPVSKTSTEQNTDKLPEVIQARAVSQVAVEAQIKAIQARKQANLAYQQKQLNKAKKAARLSRAAQKRAKTALANIKKKQTLAQKKLNQTKRMQRQFDQKRVRSQKALKQQQTLLAQTKLQAQRVLAEKRATEQRLAKEQKIRLAKEQKIRLAKEQKMRLAKEQKMRGILNEYKSRILAVIASQWIVPADANRNLACQLLIRLSSTGAVLSVRLIRSSGNAQLDRSARLAVLKASPLPVPKDPEILSQFKELRLTVRPEDIVS